MLCLFQGCDSTPAQHDAAAEARVTHFALDSDGALQATNFVDFRKMGSLLGCTSNTM